ncbi:hypothetical protein, partial [Elizabethkingia meningoseptica]|uniref:hypothetical protein n=1 Tax=Elizabethkingia meningoseptica TaxID=238 RepID=UPI00315958F3
MVSNILATQREILEDLAKLGIELRTECTRAYLATLIAQPALIDRVKNAQRNDPFLQKLKKKVETGDVNMQGFRISEDGTLWFGQRLCVPKDLGIKR